VLRRPSRVLELRVTPGLGADGVDEGVRLRVRLEGLDSLGSVVLVVVVIGVRRHGEGRKVALVRRTDGDAVPREVDEAHGAQAGLARLRRGALLGGREGGR
jgi:hypothetical protein